MVSLQASYFVIVQMYNLYIELLDSWFGVVRSFFADRVQPTVDPSAETF